MGVRDTAEGERAVSLDMTVSRPRVLIVCNREVREASLLPVDLDRLAAIADWEWLESEGGVAFGPNEESWGCQAADGKGRGR